MKNNLNIQKNVRVSIVVFALNIILISLCYKLLIKHGGIATIGLWSTLNAWIFLVRLGDIGMTSAAVRFASACDTSTEKIKIENYIDTALATNALVFLILSIIGFIFYNKHISNIINGEMDQLKTAKNVLPWIFIAFYIQNISGLSLGALTAVHRGYLAAWLTFTGTLIQLTLVTTLVPTYGIKGIATAQIAQYSFTTIAGRIIFYRILNYTTKQIVYRIVPTKTSIATTREMLEFSIKSQFTNLINGLFEPITKILIGRLAGLETLGLYELAYKYISLPRNAAISGVQASTPAMTRLLVIDRNAAKSMYESSTRKVKIYMPIILICAIIASPILSIYWLNEINSRFIIYSILIAAGFYFNALGASAYILGNASGKLSGNILSLLISTSIVLIGFTGAHYFNSNLCMILVVAIGLAASGISVKYFNENILK